MNQSEQYEQNLKYRAHLENSLIDLKRNINQIVEDIENKAYEYAFSEIDHLMVKKGWSSEKTGQKSISYNHKNRNVNISALENMSNQNYAILITTNLFEKSNQRVEFYFKDDSLTKITQKTSTGNVIRKDTSNATLEYELRKLEDTFQKLQLLKNDLSLTNFQYETSQVDANRLPNKKRENLIDAFLSTLARN
ncbi:hypothetical protein ACODTS_15110 [Acinetobacter pittii]|uniref:hypothetical protein n=1 Tax=Acinetobacter pittii TaxID=48296 RepID=UPI003B42B8EE